MNITDLVPIPKDINIGLHCAKQRTMLNLLGNPRQSYSQQCKEITNTTLRKLIVIDSIGAFSVRGLCYAVEGLKSIFAEIYLSYPDIYAALGYAGMLCCRHVRGSKYAISNHSWGTAIDLTLNDILDIRGDDKVQAGLVKIAPIFNKYGWYWGAGFRTEDAMHFECSEELIRSWFKLKTQQSVLSIGDRGDEVKELQTILTNAGYPVIIDGIFGKNTEKAVETFQTVHDLDIDGIVGEKTWRSLKK